MTETMNNSPQAAISRLYTWNHILHTERIFGLGWNSPGGEANLKDHLLKMKLRPGYSVLDVGCATGGAPFYMARNYGAYVHGVDFSQKSIQIAKERLAKENQDIRDKIRFEHGDASQMDFESSSYDVVYSHNTIFFIAEKELLYKKLYNCLKPGGTLIIGDKCRGHQDHFSKEFMEAVKERGMHLKTMNEYKTLIERAGFKNVKATDDTTRESELIEKDLKDFESTKEAFIKECSEEDYDAIVKLWRDICEWNQAGFYSRVILEARK